ncbi:YheU family protein [Halotalea alkalilenta]|uniref:Uncharacterized protein n=1 Tax=Halotalea alkalilenta TaxID=376489 RepID=A0A172YD86_9GAMM|nr:YheU family protein [Halotalea alkalilenta]ANF57219.1 hypothetical protein A5892_06865 [Halotalea alkalilenta]
MNGFEDRFITVPATMLPEELRRALLGEFATRQGYDSGDTGEGERGWVDELEAQLSRGELLIIHDLLTETTEVMTPEQRRRFIRRFDELDDDQPG